MDAIRNLQKEWRDASPIEKMFQAFNYSLGVFTIIDFLLFVLVVGALGANWYIVMFFYFDMVVNIMGVLSSRKTKFLIAYLALHTVILLTLFSLEVYFIVAYYRFYFPYGTVILHVSVGGFTILLGVYYILYTLLSAPVMYLGLMFLRSQIHKTEFDPINEHEEDSYLSD
eukprot:TRINITY_DN432_c2_g4_i1.p1 TRINITY_DN432_c2_g4~~TRINITY_DN432_c2_g4_i1.p1  ORF type:complete len:170 (+),score=80.82 TRINITY_DN432_c2_g4_i1:630-1139(+)